MSSRPLIVSQPPGWVQRAVRLGVVGAVVASLLVIAAPAHAGEPWIDVDLTAATGAPAGTLGSGFFTDLPGEGPMARIVYRTWSSEIEELYVSTDGIWRARRLTKGGHVLNAPMAYVTMLTGKSSAVARIVYGNSTGHIIELSDPGTGVWTQADLTTISGAPPLLGAGRYDDIQPFTTALPGHVPTAHVLYPTHVGLGLEDLSVSAGETWHASPLTDIGGDGYPPGTGYVTQLAGQGPVARIVYGTDGLDGQTIRELSTDGHSTWNDADISTIAGVTLSTLVAPHPYTTNLPGQGPMARVLFLDRAAGPTFRDYIGELSLTGGGTWQAIALTSPTGSPTDDDPDTLNGGDPYGYSTNLANEGPRARVVYIGMDHHVKELSSNGGRWWLADLTVITGGPPFHGRPRPWDPPMGYTSDLPGQGPAARVVYDTASGEIHEMSVTG